MIIYALETAALSVEQLETMAAALPAEKRERTERIRHATSRRESVAAAYLALYGLSTGNANGGFCLCQADSLTAKSEQVGTFAQTAGWPVDEQGKPFTNGILVNKRNLYVSLSHSDGLAATAIADVPIGIDVQRLPTESAERLFRIAAKFHPLEKEKLITLPENELPAAFCRLWACKESVMKLCGRGLSLPLSSFSIADDNTSELDSRRIRLYTEQCNNAVFAASVWTDTL